MKTRWNTEKSYGVLILIFLSLTNCGPLKEAIGMCANGEMMEATDGRPTVLVVGDSISIGYTPTIAAGLPNYQVVHNPCNASTTAWTKSQIGYWLNQRPTFEAITFNNGLWDISAWAHVSDENYRDYLTEIAQRVKTKTANPLFVLTTEVLPGTEGRIDADVVTKNNIARAVMALEGIPVLDLYSVSQTIQAEHVDATDVHFTALGSQILGTAILTALNTMGVN